MSDETIGTVGELRSLLSSYASAAPIYVYDEHADLEREIVDVGASNDLMVPGIVINIRGTIKR